MCFLLKMIYMDSIIENEINFKLYSDQIIIIKV